MHRKRVLTLVSTIAFCGVSAMSFAETTPPASTAVTSAPTPVISTSEGTVSAVNTSVTAPWLKIKDAVGREWVIMIDTASSSIWRGGNQVTWTDIKVGDKAKVRHTEKEGKVFVKTVELE